MLRLLALRLLAFVPTLIAASIVLFVTINVLPGSAARAALGIDATPQAIARFEALNGLDRPLHVQYLEWLQIGFEERKLFGRPRACEIFNQNRVNDQIRSPKFD